jgi:penicillin-insensitive murein DD-endopeptidase
MMPACFRWLVIALLLSGSAALAEDADSPDPTPPGTLDATPLPPLANPNDPSLPARELFGRKTTPFPGPAHAIGGYADGCLEGGVELPITGPAWQVMRLSRNRNWGHPKLVAFLENFATRAKGVWKGLLIGDMSQPRGGPMLTGHASHQIGLDADIWFKPMPDHVLSREEREFDSAVNMVAPDRRGVDPEVWTPARTELLHIAAEDPLVSRIFVNAAIKKQMCKEAGLDRAWLAKVRPWFGHAEHFHVRINCPADSPECKPQPPVEAGEGCGHELDYWFSESVLHHEFPPEEPGKPRPGLTLAKLPHACRRVVMAP